MPDKDDEIRELKERLERLEGNGAAPAPTPPPIRPASPKSGCGTVIVGGIGLVVVLFLVGMCSSDDSTSGPTGALTTWTPPAGFILERGARGGGIAVEWDQPTRAECRGSGTTCFAVNVVTERDCPRSLYASITLLDDAGQNMGWTNDTAQGVQAGERTRLVFDTYERGVKTARIAELNCY